MKSPNLSSFSTIGADGSASVIKKIPVNAGVGQMIISNITSGTDFIKCDKILGYHFDTFGLIEIDQTKAIEDFKKAKKELIIIKPTEHLTI